MGQKLRWALKPDTKDRLRRPRATAPQPVEEELETGEPIPEEEQPKAEKKIPGRRVTADGRPTASTEKAAAQGGQMVLATAKYMPANAFDEPKSSKGKKRGREAEADTPQSFEGRVLGGGVWGGLLAMVVAGLWFVVGLMNDYIYFYPPILFVIGLGGFFKGLNGRE